MKMAMTTFRWTTSRCCASDRQTAAASTCIMMRRIRRRRQLLQPLSMCCHRAYPPSCAPHVASNSRLYPHWRLIRHFTVHTSKCRLHDNFVLIYSGRFIGFNNTVIQRMCSDYSKKDGGDDANAANKSPSDDMSSAEPANKCIRTGKQYACTHCSYSADKKVSLNRHMRMHQTSPAPSSVTSNGDDCSSQVSDMILLFWFIYHDRRHCEPFYFHYQFSLFI